MAKKNNGYSKFVATAATATMVASAVVPSVSAAAFSDVSSTYKVAVDYLVTNKIAKGTTDTTFGTTSSITRGDAAVMIANALKLNTTNAPSAGFKDVNARVAGAVNALVEQKIVSGKTATTFQPDAKITRQEMAKIIANAYNLKAGTTKNKFTDVNSNWDGFVDALVANGITYGKTGTTFAPTASITRGEFALFVYRAEKLAPLATQVVSVTAVNAKTIEVIFSSPVDAATLQNSLKTDVIQVKTGSGAKSPGTVTQTLSEDGKTLTLTAGEFFKGDYTIAVPFETVKGTNGAYVKPVNQTVNVNDTTAPIVRSATATVKGTNENVKLVTLEFNEEIKSLEFIKVAGQNYAPKSINGKTATFTVDLDASKNHEITVVNVEDVAGNVKNLQTTNLKVNVDNVAPSITKVVSTGEKTLTVTVDEALENNELVLTGKVGSFNSNVVSSTTVNPKNDKEYLVTLNDAYLFKNGNSDTVTLTAAKGALKDSLGNTNVEDITKSVVISKDIVAPTVQKIENIVKDGKVTGFTVSYNEEVSALDTTKISVVNSKDEILSFNNIATAAISETNAKEIVYTFKPAATADSYTFDFAEGLVVDNSLAKNKSQAKSVVVKVTDAETPIETTFSIKGATATSNEITVDFGEKVKASGSASGLNASAYKLNGKTLPTNTKIVFVQDGLGVVDQTKVKITLPAGFVTASDSKAIFQVTGVQTLDNKVNNAFTTSVDVTDNTAPEAKSIVATELKEITVTYSEAIVLEDGADIKDEIKLFDNNGATVAIDAFKVVNGKLVLTVADSSAVSKLTTIDSNSIDIKDGAGVAQKTGVTINK
ncbi:S-layer homology domain-containing protein [Psychrobacillus sp. OK028]|uniref:S-layer homology domain-containing protein n=1 Tax=Psychrobacillus sp. OK028 TaxID=1884359 RepID=UPI000881DC6C|nr:S-layer homology domain-containing protein [Psychrobacillus sp. OK028]SDM35446.1 S-layer homology domain-containing protein [Psychrobacillus sp. OK028]